MTIELTDSEICDIAHSTETAEPGRDGYILPVSFPRAQYADAGITPPPGFAHAVVTPVAVQSFHVTELAVEAD